MSRAGAGGRATGKRTRARHGGAAAAAANDEQGSDRGASNDEQPEEEEGAAADVVELDRELVDDASAHVVGDAAAEAASSKQKKKAVRAPVEGVKKRISKWSHEEQLSLCAAIGDFVTNNKGQLPSSLRTAASTPCTKQWKEIGEAVKKLELEGLDAAEAGKAASAQWSSLRSAVRVRHKQTSKQDEHVLGQRTQLLTTRSVYARVCFRPRERRSTQRTRQRWKQP